MLVTKISETRLRELSVESKIDPSVCYPLRQSLWFTKPNNIQCINTTQPM